MWGLELVTYSVPSQEQEYRIIRMLAGAYHMLSAVLHNTCNQGPLSSRNLHDNNNNKMKTGLDQPRRPNEKEKEGKNVKMHLRRHPLPYMLIPVPFPRRPLLPQPFIPPGH